MSIESAKEFYNRVATDPSLRAQIESSSSEERITLLQGLGYNFTQEEWEAATAEILETASIDEELNEIELEAVAGGITNWIRGIFPGVIALYGVIYPKPETYL